MDVTREPIAYWLDVAHRAVIAHIRAELVKLGLTQPQYWILRNLHPGDLGREGAPPTVAELTERMLGYLQPGDDLRPAADDLAARGLVDRDGDGGLSITGAGRELHALVKSHAPAIRDGIHRGVDDAEYAAALSVLQRVMRNVGVDPAAA